MGSMREEDLAKDAALAHAFEHQKDAEAHAASGAEAGSAGGNSSKQAGGKQAAASKPYRYVENYTLRGPKVRPRCVVCLLGVGCGEAWVSGALHGRRMLQTHDPSITSHPLSSITSHHRASRSAWTNCTSAPA